MNETNRTLTSPAHTHLHTLAKKGIFLFFSPKIIKILSEQKSLYVTLYSPTYSYNSVMYTPSPSRRLLSTQAFMLMKVGLCIYPDSLTDLHTFKFLIIYIYIYTIIHFMCVYFSCHSLCKSIILYTIIVI